MSIEHDQWLEDLMDFVEECGGSMGQEQRADLFELVCHIPGRDDSGDLWYRRFGEEAVKNFRLTKELNVALAEIERLKRREENWETWANAHVCEDGFR